MYYCQPALGKGERKELERWGSTFLSSLPPTLIGMVKRRPPSKAMGPICTWFYAAPFLRDLLSPPFARKMKKTSLRLAQPFLFLAWANFTLVCLHANCPSL